VFCEATVFFVLVDSPVEDLREELVLSVSSEVVCRGVSGGARGVGARGVRAGSPRVAAGSLRDLVGGHS
jgi:hypothetical protein